MMRVAVPVFVLASLAALGCSDLTSPSSITIQKEPVAPPAANPQQQGAPGDTKPAVAPPGAPGGVVPAAMPPKPVLEPAGPNGCG